MPVDSNTRPADFVDLRKFSADIQAELPYFTGDNFMGIRLDGYEADCLLMTRPTADALVRIQRELSRAGLGLKIFDAYRPRRAVAHIIRWARGTDEAPSLKAAYYPNLDRSTLIEAGYLVRDSSHSRGSTVDLTLIDCDTGKELDMGTPFDFFDPRSWPASRDVSDEAYTNRQELRHLMEDHGFIPLDTEWWHFTLADEPYPDTWFDFPVR